MKDKKLIDKIFIVIIVISLLALIGASVFIAKAVLTNIASIRGVFTLITFIVFVIAIIFEFDFIFKKNIFKDRLITLISALYMFGFAMIINYAPDYFFNYTNYFVLVIIMLFTALNFIFVLLLHRDNFSEINTKVLHNEKTLSKNKEMLKIAVSLIIILLVVFNIFYECVNIWFAEYLDNYAAVTSSSFERGILILNLVLNLVTIIFVCASLFMNKKNLNMAIVLLLIFNTIYPSLSASKNFIPFNLLLPIFAIINIYLSYNVEEKKIIEG